ncbi:MAG: hypothetical protein QXQ66_06750 [Candidatus Hadarchaeum sp.]|uniref:hypothetical protein n=1 Tax=Candidatus Hadarchaeum sp. TaxID=2883567 RepID=UPI0031784FC3
MKKVRKYKVITKIFVLTAILTGLFSLTLLVSNQPPQGDEGKLSQFGGPVPLDVIAEKLTFEQLVDRLKEINATISIPTWMPENLKLTMVYYKPPVIVLVYSDRGVMDYRYANASVEISLWYYDTPSDEELEGASSKGIKIVSIKDVYVQIRENAKRGFSGLKYPYDTVTVADFVYSDKHHYLISVLPPLIDQDLLKIVENMRPIP